MKKKDAGLLVFEADQVVSRFEKMGDLFEPVLDLKQKLPDVKKTGVVPATVPRGIEIAAQAEKRDSRPPKSPQKKKSAGKTSRKKG
jgi:bifunctional non-homologous end joining protein LigD